MRVKPQAPLIWDLPTRLCHWSLALAVTITWLSGGENVAIHQWAGALVVNLVLFRALWGFIGGHYARFAHFVVGPRSMLRHLCHVLHPGRLPAEPGHNPLGGAMVVALLSLLAIQGALGLLSDDDIAFVGPLGGLVSYSMRRLATGWHDAIGKLILIAVLLHIIAILYYKWRKKRNLVPAMITGRDKELSPELALAPESCRSGSLALAALTFVATSALVAAIMVIGPTIAN